MLFTRWSIKLKKKKKKKAISRDMKEGSLNLGHLATIQNTLATPEQ